MVGDRGKPHRLWFKFWVLFVITFVALYSSLLVQVKRRKQRQGRYSRYNAHRSQERYL